MQQNKTNPNERRSWKRSKCKIKTEKKRSSDVIGRERNAAKVTSLLMISPQKMAVAFSVGRPERWVVENFATAMRNQAIGISLEDDAGLVEVMRRYGSAVATEVCTSLPLFAFAHASFR